MILKHECPSCEITDVLKVTLQGPHQKRECGHCGYSWFPQDDDKLRLQVWWDNMRQAVELPSDLDNKELDALINEFIYKTKEVIYE